MGASFLMGKKQSKYSSLNYLSRPRGVMAKNGKVKSAYEPSGPSGLSLSRFP